MQLNKYLIGIILSSYTLLFAQSILAAPFCAVSPYSVNCWYYNYPDCQRAIGTQEYCGINRSEARQPSIGAKYCVVTPTNNIECFYSDFMSCKQAATASSGVCLSIVAPKVVQQ